VPRRPASATVSERRGGPARDTRGIAGIQRNPEMLFRRTNEPVRTPVIDLRPTGPRSDDRRSTVALPSRFLRSIEPSRVDGLAGAAMLVLVARGLGLPIPGGHLAADVVLVIVGFQLGLVVRALGGTRRWIRRYWLSAIGPLAIPTVVAVGLAIAYWWWVGRLGPEAVRGAVAALTMTSNLVGPISDVAFPATAHLWLIVLVIQFSLLVPFAVVHARRTGANHSIVRLAFVAAAVVAALRLALALTGRFEAATLAQMTPTRLDGLLVGAGVALAPSYLLRRVPPTIASPALACLAVVVALSPDPASHPVIALGLLVPIVVVAAAAVVACQTVENHGLATGRLLDHLVLRWLGERAISIFIWHQMFGMALTDQGTDPVTEGVFGGSWPGFGLFVTRLVFALAAGAASYRYLQLPLRSRITATRPAPTPTQ
jgi:peptidoglycan/LPS O-acetylase OafA/YrhL